MNHVEEYIPERVARLSPDVFQALDEFCAGYGGYIHKTIRTFDRKIQFYVGSWTLSRR